MNTRLSAVMLALVITGAMVAWPAHVTGQGRGTGRGRGEGGASRAEAEKNFVANERAIQEAFIQGDLAKFRSLVAPDSWAVDPMAGRMPIGEFFKQFPQMTKDLKLTSWDITDVKTLWLDDDAAILTYKWTGSGTIQGQPVPSPTWASTAWSKRGGKWQPIYHQETVALPPPKR